MLEFILDISPVIFAGGMIFIGWMMDKNRRESRAKKITERRQAEYAAEVAKAGERVRRLMAASAPLGVKKGGAAEDKPKTVVTVMASPKSCVVRKLPAGRREAMIRELIENGSKVQEK